MLKGLSLKDISIRYRLPHLIVQAGNCADVCPAKEKALIMKPFESQHQEIENWDYVSKNVRYKDNLAPKTNVKNSQFAQPLIGQRCMCRLW